MPQLRAWTRDDTRRLLRAPSAADDKYSRGVVALQTGSPAYPGAAVLGVEGAWRTGPGSVRFVGDENVARSVLARRPETVVLSLDAEPPHADAWVIGSGSDERDRSDVERVLSEAVLGGATPVVVDAGALDLAPGCTAPLIVTPHTGELARLRRLLGLAEIATEDLQEITTRAAVASETAHTLGGAVLLKGAQTVVASPSDAPTILVEEGTGWLATAGTGDVLAGVVGALLAANPLVDVAEVAAGGAFLHGRAGRIASGAGRDGACGRPVVAMDVAEAMPLAIEELLS